MANNYLTFSFALGPFTSEELAWVKATIDDHSVREDDQQIDEDFFDYEFDDSSVVIYSEEYGDIEAVTEFVKALQEKFPRHSPVGFSWAETCSKPRPGEFGGGAVVVDAGNVEWVSTYHWLKDRIKK